MVSFTTIYRSWCAVGSVEQLRGARRVQARLDSMERFLRESA
jgi:hypothetical protein